MPEPRASLAIWSLTAAGARCARRLGEAVPSARRFVSARYAAFDPAAEAFDALSAAMADRFHAFGGHVCFMATGIVVRIISPLLLGKTRDPAVVVVDEGGAHAISLLSGHLGGANRLAREVAAILGAEPVITTATDIQGLPAIDLLAMEAGLLIENPAAIKGINQAILNRETLCLYDPRGIFSLKESGLSAERIDLPVSPLHGQRPVVCVDDRLGPFPETALVLRPRSLLAGIGCNRHTSGAEIRDLLDATLAAAALSPSSLGGIASIDLKRDEPGLLALGRDLGLPLSFYTAQALNRVETVQHPSEQVRRAVGARSVCEAAAILAAGRGDLVVSKTRSKNATVAVARRPSTWWASARAAPSTCPGAP
jgi:cobalt-precorrin 5A hydrolase